MTLWTFLIYQNGTKNFLISSNPGECIMNLSNNVTAIKFEIIDFEKKLVFT